MRFTNHSSILGRHAFLSPSSPAWLNYEEDKLDRVFTASMAAQRGTELHELAHRLIKLKVKLPDIPKTLNLYVNDAIGYRMTPEQTLFYSDNCFGTADVIGFQNNRLRIHDLKTGTSNTPMAQLEIYASLFCLEYKFSPFDIGFELRIYKNDKVEIHEPTADSLFHIIDKIVTFDKRLNSLRSEALS